MINWKNEKRDLNTLIPAEYNPRALTDKQHDNLLESITRFNLADPIIINKDNTIIGGHQRIKLLIEKSVDEVDVRVPDRLLTKDEEKNLNLRLNKNLGEWDYNLLADFDKDMLLDVGFDLSELDKIFVIESDEKDDVIPDNAPAVSQLGDIYILGNHRLMCGDSTSVDAVERLMDGKIANLTFHSPPYNVGHNIGYKTKSKYINSDDNSSDYVDLIKDSTTLALEYSKDVFVNLQFLANNKKDLLKWLSDLSDYFKDIYFWKKLQVAPAIAENVANSQVEVIFLFGKDGTRRFGTKKFRGNFSNHIETDSASGENKNSKIHNATFPVELPLRFIDHAYNYGDLVLDLFSGCGTTLIACEKTNRICYGMELDPKYCDVIIKRWEDYTGKKAKLIGSKT